MYPARQYWLVLPADGRLLLSEVRLYLLLLGRDLFLDVTDARSFFQARPLERFVSFAISIISFQIENITAGDPILVKDVLDLIDQCGSFDIVSLDFGPIFASVTGTPVLF